MSARRCIVDGRRPEVNGPPDHRWTSGRRGDAVRLTVDGSTRDGRPADRVEARVVEAKNVALADTDVLLGVERNVDESEVRRTNKSLRHECVRRHGISGRSVCRSPDLVSCHRHKNNTS